MKQAALVLTGAIVMSCQPSQTPAATGPRSTYGTAAPGTGLPPPASSTDPGVVYGDHKKWCYAERDEDNEGDCTDVLEVCQQVRNKRSEWDLIQVLRTVPDDKKQTEEQRLPYARAVLKGLTPCERWDASACFSGTEVVQGYKFELCFPTMSTCVRKLAANHGNPDVSLATDRCYVYRARGATGPSSTSAASARSQAD